MSGGKQTNITASLSCGGSACEGLEAQRQAVGWQGCCVCTSRRYFTGTANDTATPALVAACRFAIEDLSARVPVDISEAERTHGLFTGEQAEGPALIRSRADALGACSHADETGCFVPPGWCGCLCRSSAEAGPSPG
jgi:hypothetical protein